MRRRSLISRAWPWVGALLLALVSFRWLFRGEVQAARDLYAQFFPETFVLVERWKSLEVPLWLPNERLGQPFLALLYTQVFYLPRVLTGLVFGHVRGPSVMHALHCCWAFTGAFFALRSTGRSRAGAFVGAAAWGFSPFFVELSQNLAFASSAAWAGWAWWATDRLVRTPVTTPRVLPWHVARLGLVVGAAFHAGAPEMVLWQTILVMLIAAFARSPRPALARTSLGLLVAALLSAVVALPAAELVLEWTRPGEAAGGLLAWSMSWHQLGSIAIPDADFPRAEPFFGADQRFFFTLLLGPATVALALLGHRRRTRPIVLLALGCGVLALGVHLLPASWLLQLPPFRFFRFPVKYAAGLLFALSMLAGSGVDRLLVLARRGRLQLPTGALVGVAVGVFLASKVGTDLRDGFVQGARWALLSLVLLALLARVRWRRALVPSWIAAELVAMPHRTWPPEPIAPYLVPSPIAQSLGRHWALGRVSIRVDTTDPGPWSLAEEPEVEAERVVRDSRQRLSVLRYLEEGLESTSGYGFRDPWRLARAFEQGEGAFHLAGVTRFVRNAGEPLPFQGPVPSRTAIDDVWVWEFPEWKSPGWRDPRHWIVDRWEVMGDDEAFSLIGRTPNPPRDFAPINEPIGAIEQGGVDCPSSGPAEIERQPESLRCTVRACGRAVMVVADAWYPGWRVWVDGVEAKPLRVWGFLRGVAVERGRHEIEWRYDPLTYRVGKWLSGLVLLGCVAARGWARRRVA